MRDLAGISRADRSISGDLWESTGTIYLRWLMYLKSDLELCVRFEPVEEFFGGID